MKRITKVLFAAAGGVLGLWLAARYGMRRAHRPCPYWLSGVLENPLVEAVAGAQKLLDILDVQPGMSFLDVGSGPGRVSIPAAERVGQQGSVTALDIQPEMLAIQKSRAEQKGIHNIQYLQGAAGTGLLAENQYDRAVLVTVLGETPDPLAVLAEIQRALKPGGRLGVSEFLPDPHFQTQATVRRLAGEAGLKEVSLEGKPWAYTLVLEK